MWWNKPKVEKSRFEQLTEARDKLRRQIEILNMGTGAYRNASQSVPMLVAELTAELTEIERELWEERSTSSKTLMD